MSDAVWTFERPPEYADEPALPVWPSFLEKFLLTIIDAYPPDRRPAPERAADPHRQQRLDAALKAIVGREVPKGNRERYVLHAAVAAADFEMPKASAAALEGILDPLPVKRTKAPSKRRAFEKYADAMGGQSAESREKRLKAFERANRTYLQHIALFRDHPEEEDMFRDMLAIASILQRWNIECAIEPEVLGLASLWGRK